MGEDQTVGNVVIECEKYDKQNEADEHDLNRNGMQHEWEWMVICKEKIMMKVGFYFFIFFCLNELLI